MSTPVRFAILSMAHVHAPAYAAALQALPETELVAIWDDDSERGLRAGTNFGVPCYVDLHDLLRRDDIEAVIITSENVNHRDLALAAAEAGKAILCEKPIATVIDDAEAMIAAAQTYEVILATAFPVRHNLPALRTREALRSGAIGEPIAIQATNHGTLPPGWFTSRDRAGGGAVMDHTVHVADLLRWYLGQDPVDVYAEMSNRLYGLSVEDTAFLTLRFPSGVVATLDPSWSRPPSFPTWGDVTMEIAGTRGTLQLDAFAQRLVLSPAQSQHVEWIGWGADMDRAMILDFARAVRNGTPPAASGRDGERALAVVAAAYASAQSGRPEAVAAPPD
ncbi:MAG TPA: Gfo/Idh/MocA family oxidoreductase [Chloroflexota bacterium]|nr:Gfo/Idh/MocA family oxidoreductase [Chloroflexota bacterium]